MRFSALERRVFTAATAALTGEAVEAAQTERFLADVSRRAPPKVAWGLRLLLWATLLSPLLLWGRPRSFLGLGLDEQIRLWERALSHRRPTVRQLATVLKAMGCLCHFDLDARPHGGRRTDVPGAALAPSPG